MRRQSYYYESTINPSASIIELSQLVDKKTNSILFRDDKTFINNQDEEEKGDENYIEDFDYNTLDSKSMQDVPILTIAEEIAESETNIS